ncbi:MAG TPA: sigma-70 family RNA polymerase sigma factor [Kofleriaceae bacterium]
MDELAAAFLTRLPAEFRGNADAIAGELHELVARARREAPDVDLDPLGFVAHAAERVTFDAQGRPALGSLHAGDLWIAYGCVAKHDGALAAFEVRFAPEIKKALSRSFERALAEDAEHKLREKLLLVGDDELPRLASYAGRGALGGWLRAAAVRMAVDLMRSRRELPADPASFGDAAAGNDPLLASLKERYRTEFRAAFGEAAAQLTDRDRTLLKYRFVDGLSIDEIGPLYGVHRATIARWLASTRENLFELTRATLMARLSIADSDVDSILRLIDSQLEISIEAVMR